MKPKHLYAAPLIALAALFSCATPSATRPTESALSLGQAIERMGGDIQAKIPQGAKIAVVEFASESANLSAYLMEDLNIALLNNGLSVIDRANLDAVRRELNFNLSCEVSDESALAIGRFLGAAYVVTGQFRPAGSDYPTACPRRSSTPKARRGKPPPACPCATTQKPANLSKPWAARTSSPTWRAIKESGECTGAHPQASRASRSARPPSLRARQGEANQCQNRPALDCFGASCLAMTDGRSELLEKQADVLKRIHKCPVEGSGQKASALLHATLPPLTAA
jgi:hypothetical protein